MTSDERPAYGRRLMPAVLDELALKVPNRVYAAIPKTNDVKDGFQDITVSDVARTVNFTAWWIEERFGKSETFETVAYIGIPDLRGPILFQALIKCGFKILLLSPRNPPSTNVSLMRQTNSTKLLHASEVSPLIQPVLDIEPIFRSEAIPSFSDMITSHPAHYPFMKSFDEARDEPAAVLHSSGSTGLPKPIVMTHGSFSVLDNEHNLPEVPGRKKRDWTMWSFQGEGRLYTVFPFFHLGGFLMFTVATILGNTTNVYGPPFLTPDGKLVRDIMLQQRLRALLLPPSIVEDVILEPSGLDCIKRLDFLAYSGAPLNSSTGDELSKFVDVFSPYGATETYPQPELATTSEDWVWHEFNPHVKHEMQIFDSEEGTYELVIISDDSTKGTAAVHHNLPHERGEFRTKDLFFRHPEKPSLFKYYGRKDDIITLSNGEKFNPIPLELSIQSHPDLKGALVIGSGRPHPALLVEPVNPTEEPLEALWPLIEKSNTLVPGQGRIHRGMVIVASPDVPFTRTGKGTIVRRITHDAYAAQIEKLYMDFQDAGIQIPLEADPQTHEYDRATISTFLRRTLSQIFPAAVNIEEDQDFYSLGLDSIQTIMMVSSLKRSLQPKTPESCAWLTPRTIFSSPTIKELSGFLHVFLNRGIAPTPTAWDGFDDVTPTYLSTLPDTAGSDKLTKGREKPSIVAVVGSTGFLGSELVANMLLDPAITHVYCLNRSKTAQERQVEALIKLDQQNLKPLLHKLEYFTVELGKPRLALTDKQYEQLATNVDAIVFNAWKLDFGLRVRSFHPFLHSLVEVVKLANESERRMSILFVSSLSSVGNMAMNMTVPEAPVQEPLAAGFTGYAQSKLAAERILTAANEKCGIPVCVARVCQLIGQETGSASSDQSWLSAIVKTSKTLNLIPAGVAMIDWLHVDVAAKMLSNFLNSPTGNEPRFYHVTHPQPQPWNLLADVLRERLDGAKVVPLRDWVEELKAITTPTTEDVKAMPALAMLDFFDGLARSTGKYTYATGRSTNATSVRLSSIDRQFIENWFGDWAI